MDTQVQDQHAVIYTDGGARPTNPGYMGWGAHGYIFSVIAPTKGSGHPTQSLTDIGYVPKSLSDKPKKAGEDDEEDDDVKAQEPKAGPSIEYPPNHPVTILKYLDFCGSSQTQETNNVAELLGFKNSMRYLLENFPALKTILVHADSQYVVRGVNEWHPIWISNRWTKRDGRPVENKDIWIETIEVLKALESKGICLTVKWVKGHGDDAGNIIADELASLGTTLSANSVFIQEYETSEAQGYWKTTVERHPLLDKSRMYFNSCAEMNHAGEYYFGYHGADDEDLGTPRPDTGFSIVLLKEPDLMLEMVRNHQISVADGFNSVIIARLDRIYNPRIYKLLSEYGANALYMPDKAILSLEAPDKSKVTVECRPARKSLEAVEVIGVISDILGTYQENRQEGGVKNTDRFMFIDITDQIFFQEKIEKKGKPVRFETKLKPDFTSAKKILEIKKEIPCGIATDQTVEATFSLVLDQDMPSRNSMRKLESMQPRVILAVDHSLPERANYFTIVDCQDAVGIWTSYWSNFIFHKPS